MEAPQAREFVYALQQREVNGEQLPIRTVSSGLVSLLLCSTCRNHKFIVPSFHVHIDLERCERKQTI